MRILVLGGDGYLGWPQALYFSQKGHEVAIFDSLQRRYFDLERGFNSLLPIETLQERVRIWRDVSGCTIDVYIGDATEYDVLAETFRAFQPEAVVHFAEQ